MFTRGELVVPWLAIALIALLAPACSGSGDDDDVVPGGPGATTLGELDASTNPDGSPKPPGDDGGLTDDSGVVSSCVTAETDPAAATTIGGYLDKLGGAGPQGALRPKVIDAILRSCEMFGPSAAKNAGWQRNYCWAHVASELLKESSYNPNSVVNDAYGKRTVSGQTANDPTVGLFQIRFSSALHNYVAGGSISRLSCVGCTLPSSLAAHKTESGDSAFWAVSGPTANLSTLEDVACNVGLGTWYLYLNATGNGKASAPTYLDGYCKGQGTAGNLITGFRSYVEGPTSGKGIVANQAAFDALQSSDSKIYNYVTAVRGSFDSMITPSGTHPFFALLAPSPSQFCK